VNVLLKPTRGATTYGRKEYRPWHTCKGTKYPTWGQTSALTCELLPLQLLQSIVTVHFCPTVPLPHCPAVPLSHCPQHVPVVSLLPPVRSQDTEHLAQRAMLLQALSSETACRSNCFCEEVVTREGRNVRLIELYLKVPTVVYTIQR
jgi:hypothetical protein